MAKNNDFNKLKRMSAVSMAEERKKSVNWMKDSIEDIRKKQTGDPNKIFSTSKLPQIGSMCLFVYDAKLKEKLPFFDVYPLVFPIEFYGDGFLGINFHYLPPAARLRLLEALVSITDNDKYDAKRKLNLSYELLKSYSTQLKGVENCIKRYLYGHVRSSFHTVNRDDWVRAVLLPLQRWSINSNKAKAGRPPY